MDVSGIIGPLLSALLLPLAGVSFIFGANGLGFLLMFLAILQWKRVRAQSSLPLENFFESLTTAIRYVRYIPGIKILLARHRLFSFFISIIPSLMPVVGLKELLRSLRTDPNPPEEWISLSVEKEVLNKRVRTGGLPPGYVDQ